MVVVNKNSVSISVWKVVVVVVMVTVGNIIVWLRWKQRERSESFRWCVQQRNSETGKTFRIMKTETGVYVN